MVGFTHALERRQKMASEKLSEQHEELESKSGQDRRTFMRNVTVAGGMVALGTGLFPVIGQKSADAQSHSHLSNVEVKKYLVTPKPDGKEVEMEIEGLGDDGKKDVTRFYGRWAYAGDSYNIFGHVSASRFQPESTFSVSGKKGHVEADYRHDTMSMVIIAADGTIHRLLEADAKVPVNPMYPGLSEEERINRYLRDKTSGPNFWQTLALL
jgi:hypothetical protein